MARAAAEQILRKSLEEVAHEQKYAYPNITISTVSTEGANFTSFLFDVKISSKDKDDLNLFAKVSAVGELMRSQAPMRMFDVERIFYTELAKEYRQLEDDHRLPEQHRFKAPQIYACSPTLYKETVVMENLTSKGYTLHDRFKSVDWDYAAASFTELAKMHALSMALKHEKPDTFKRFLEEFKIDWSMFKGGMQPFIEQTMQRTLEVTRDENRERVMAFMGKVMEGGGIEEFLKFYLPGESPVIRHGDYRPSNLMHRLRVGSLDVVPVDYQTLQPGTPVIDLLYFIFLGTDQQFREKHFDQLVEHYYKELTAAVSRLGLDPERTYSRQKFDDDMKENLNYGLIVGLTTLALVTVDTADAPDVNGEHDISSFMNMKFGSVFAERLNGIFDDFIKWGIL